MLQKFDDRNENIMIHVGGKLLPRPEAKVSVFDSSVQGGDAVWEGIRVYEEGVFCLDRHLARLKDSAMAMLFSDIPEPAAIKQAIRETLEANGMMIDTHIRLTLTRGEKITSGMDPRLNTKGCTLIVLAEWKLPVYDNAKGIRVITSAIRRNIPEFVDSKIHHNNLINNILAKIQANNAGADDALMLDRNGFAAELNGTNIFMIKNGQVLTPYADACLPGITRGLIMEICRANDIPCMEKNISLAELYSADEIFCTGTMGEITPVRELDGRPIDCPYHMPMTIRLQDRFRDLRKKYCTSITDL